MSESEIPEKLGRYEIVRELGKGAMGVVYEGRDPNIGRRVALKTARRDVLAASGMAEEMMERFLREARAAGTLNHPNIITIYDTDEEDGTAWIAMEFIEGSDLREMLVERRGLELSRILEIGAEICDALDAAHKKGIVHRDIKPANILITSSGSVKVADFGIAHVTDSTLTQEGALIGTPHYMSPEQFMGQNIDGRADLFSVGIILYELLTGEKPFAGEALSTVMHHVIKTDPVLPSELNLSIPQHVDHVLLKAMSKRPQDRYDSGGKLAAALRECKKDNPEPAILGVDPASGGATVISPGAEPTLAGPPVAPAAGASNDATLPSAATPPIDNDATLPSAPTSPPGDETIPSQVTPAGAPKSDPIPETPEPSNRKSGQHAAMILGGILVVAIGFWWVFVGAGARGSEDSTPATNPPGEVVEKNYFSKVIVDLRMGNENDGPYRYLPSYLEDNPEFTVDPGITCVVYDADTMEQLAEEEVGKFPSTITWDTGQPEALILELFNDQGRSIRRGEADASPDKPNDTCGKQHFIVAVE